MAFQLISENKFIGSSDGIILSWCPTMDLLTVSMNRMSLWVYRVNGERVYSVNNRSPITDIAWKPDGQCFALMGIDGLCKIYDSNNGSLIHVVAGSGSSAAKPKLNITQGINWSVMMDSGELAKKIAGNKSPISSSLLSSGTQWQRDSSLPSSSPLKTMQGIFDLDISTQLPSLPSSSTQSRVIVDDMNNACSDFLIIIDSTKSISLTFHNLFTIDAIQLPQENIKKYLDLATFTLDKQFLLAEYQSVDESASQGKYGMVEMNFNLESKFQSYLIEVTSQCSKILSLLAYIDEIFQSLLNNEITPYMDILDRYLSNFKDCLYEDVDLTQYFPTSQEAEDKMSLNLYDIVITNLVDPKQKDYWVNQFGERGIKRLQGSGNAAYDSVRRICFSQLVAALERLIIVLSRLQGLSKWLDSESYKREDGNDLGISTRILTTAIEIAGELLKKVYKFIWEINEEQKLFNYFMEWISKVIVERLIKEDDILSSNDVLNEKYVILKGYKNRDVMKYIDDYLFNSKILSYVRIEKEWEVIHPPAPAKGSSESSSSSILSDTFATLKSTLQDSFLTAVRDVMTSNITFSSSIPLPIPDISGASTSPATSPKMKIDLERSFGYISTIFPTSLKLVRFHVSDPASTIRDITIQFNSNEQVTKSEILIERDELLVLSNSGNGTYLLDAVRLSGLFDGTPESSSSIPYSDIRPSRSSVLSAEEEFTPVHLSVNARIGCLLDQGKQKYKIFANEEAPTR